MINPVKGRREILKYSNKEKGGPVLVWKLRAGLSGMVKPARVKSTTPPPSPKPILASHKPPHCNKVPGLRGGRRKEPEIDK